MLKSDIVDGFQQNKTQKLQKVITFDLEVTDAKYYIYSESRQRDLQNDTPFVGGQEGSRDLSHFYTYKYLQKSSIRPVLEWR